MERLSPTGTSEQLAADLLARSLRAWFDAQAADGRDAYQLGLRDAYSDAAALTLDPTGGLVERLAAEMEDAVAQHCTRASAERVAAIAVHRVLAAARRSRPRLDWVGPLAFRTRHPGPPGVDHDFGDDWGELGEVRVSWRADPGGTVGLLYAYDPTWNEYATLAAEVPRAAVEGAVAAVRAPGGHTDVESLQRALDSPTPAVPRIRPPSATVRAEL